jgi:hypothetical protein
VGGWHVEHVHSAKLLKSIFPLRICEGEEVHVGDGIGNGEIGVTLRILQLNEI